MWHSGQRCTAVKIVLVMESVADTLMEKVNAKVAKLTVGPPEEDCDITPVVSESSANFIEGLVMDAKEKGATFCQPYRREGNLIWPLLLDNVRPDMRIAWEEPFGPVLPVIRIGSVEEGINHCNASNFGLQVCIQEKASPSVWFFHKILPDHISRSVFLLLHNQDVWNFRNSQAGHFAECSISLEMHYERLYETKTKGEMKWNAGLCVHQGHQQGNDNQWCHGNRNRSDQLSTSSRARPFPFPGNWELRPKRASSDYHVSSRIRLEMLLLQGLKDSGIGSQGITNSINMMVKVKSTVINLPSPSYTMGWSKDNFST